MSIERVLNFGFSSWGAVVGQKIRLLSEARIISRRKDLTQLATVLGFSLFLPASALAETCVTSVSTTSLDAVTTVNPNFSSALTNLTLNQQSANALTSAGLIPVTRFFGIDVDVSPGVGSIDTTVTSALGYDTATTVGTSSSAFLTNVVAVPTTGAFVNGITAPTASVVNCVTTSDSGATALGPNAFGCGVNAAANGIGATASGSNAQATGERASAFGSNSVEKLTEAFQSFRIQQLDISAIILYAPIVKGAPVIDGNGQLRLQGYYPTRPNAVYFDIVFLPEHQKWRMDGIYARVAPPPVVTKTPEREIISTLSVRAEPALAGKLLETLVPGRKVSLLGLSDDGAWYKVEFAENKVGYINASALKRNSR